MKLTLLLIPLILLSSCTIDWNDEKDAKIAVLEKQITELKEKNDDGLFKKNKECFQMKEGIEKKWKTLVNNFIEVKAIFFSTSLKTCIGELIFETRSDEDKSIYGGTVTAIFDILSNQEIINSEGIGANGYTMKTDTIDKELIHLKN